MQKNSRQSRKINRSIKLDRVNPQDFRNYNMLFACEDCSHFKSDTTECTLGFRTEPHLMSEQIKKYHLHGHMAFCRFHEID